MWFDVIVFTREDHAYSQKILRDIKEKQWKPFIPSFKVIEFDIIKYKSIASMYNIDTIPSIVIKYNNEIRAVIRRWITITSFISELIKLNKTIKKSKS